MVLLDSDVSTEEPTPPLRRAGTALVPPPPPPEASSGDRPSEAHREHGPSMMEPTADLPPEDVEATIVDSEPPSFSTDAYRVVRDRRDS